MTKPFDKKKQEEYFSQLINRKLLEKALHPYQSEAFLQLLRPIFTGVVRPPENKEEAVDGKVPYRPQALEICQQFFHYCKDGMTLATMFPVIYQYAYIHSYIHAICIGYSPEVRTVARICII